MKGYKGTNKNMRCKGFRYEIGKTYTLDGELEMCKNGFHFCRNLKDVFDFYSNEKGNRFFEIEATGEIIENEIKNVASSIKFVRELSAVEVNRAYYGNGNGYGNGYGYNIQKVLKFK